MRTFIVLMACAAIGGCGVANPTTQLSVNPFTRTITFRDSKDNDLRIGSASYDAQTHAFTLENLIVQNNASQVRAANVAQLEQVNAQLKTLGENFAAGVQSLTALVSRLAAALPYLPGYAGNVPLNGSAAPSDEARLTAIEEAISRINEKLDTLSTAATQPGD